MRCERWKEEKTTEGRGFWLHRPSLYFVAYTECFKYGVLQQQSKEELAVLQADLLLPVLVLLTTNFEGDLMG